MRRSVPGRAWLLAALAVAPLAWPPAAPAQAARRRGLDQSRIRPSAAARPSPSPPPHLDPVRAGDDATFRPTVVIRRGKSQGTGTIIATAADRSLILTAAHVLRDAGPVLIELHRYNIGLEKSRGGDWPLIVLAEVVASDPAADVAILSIRGPSPLPFVASLFEGHADELAPGQLARSLGVDQGSRVASWDTKLVESAQFQLEDGGAPRPYIITLKIPAHGRSGGGLYTAEGRLIGVCVGHAEMYEGRRMGVFASIVSVRRLLREHDLETAVARSQARAQVPAGSR